MSDSMSSFEEKRKVINGRLEALLLVHGRLQNADENPIRTPEERQAVAAVIDGTIAFWAKRARASSTV